MTKIRKNNEIKELSNDELLKYKRELDRKAAEMLKQAEIVQATMSKVRYELESRYSELEMSLLEAEIEREESHEAYLDIVGKIH